MDIKHLQSAEGELSVEGTCTIHKGQANLSKVMVDGVLELGGKSVEAVIKCPLASSKPIRDLTRAEKKSILWYFYLANRAAIQASGEAGMHDYYKMLAWMHGIQFFERKHEHAWILSEMTVNAGAWEWDYSKWASPSEVAVFNLMKNKEPMLGALRLEAMRVCMKSVYQTNQSAIISMGSSDVHPYFYMLKWLDDTSYFARNINQAWMRPLVIEHAAHWGWRVASRSPEEQRLYDVFIGNAGRAEVIHYQKIKHWFKHHPRQESDAPADRFRNWMCLPIFMGSSGYAPAMEDLFRPWDEDDEPVLYQSPEILCKFYKDIYKIGQLNIGKKGAVRFLPGGSMSADFVRNDGKVQALQSPLRLYNTAGANLGVIEMNNDALVVELDDGSDLAAYVEGSAHQWLTHKLRLTAYKLHLTRGWHWTYRNEDGSHAPFMMGDEAEMEVTWEEWRAKPSTKKVGCDVSIDVIEFINQALLKVSGKVEIATEGDLDNRQGRIYAGLVVARSDKKILIGQGNSYPQHWGREFDPYWGWEFDPYQRLRQEFNIDDNFQPIVSYDRFLVSNGAGILCDYGLDMYGEKGIDIHYGLLDVAGPAVLKSSGNIHNLSSRTVFHDNLRIEGPSYTHGCESQNSDESETNTYVNRYYPLGDTARLLVGKTLDLVVDVLTNRGSHITAVSGIFDKKKRSLTREFIDAIPADEKKFFTMEALVYGVRAQDRGYPRHPGWNSSPSAMHPSFSSSGRIDLHYAHASLNGLIAAGSLHMDGSTLSVRGGSPCTQAPTTRQLSVSLMEGAKFFKDLTQYLQPHVNPDVAMVWRTVNEIAPLIEQCVVAVPRKNIPAITQRMLEAPTPTTGALVAISPLQDRPFMRHAMDLRVLAWSLVETMRLYTGKSFAIVNTNLFDQVKRLLENARQASGGKELMAIEDAQDWQQEPIVVFEPTDVHVCHSTETVLTPRLIMPTALIPGSHMTVMSEDGPITFYHKYHSHLERVCLHASKDGRPADVTVVSEGTQTHKGVKVSGENLTIAAGQGIEVREDQHIEHYEHREGKRTVQGVKVTSIANTYEGKNVVFFTPSGSLIFQNIVVDAEKFQATAPEGVVRFLAGVNSEQRSIIEKGGDFMFDRLRQTVENHKVHVPCRLDGAKVIEVTSKHAFFEQPAGRVMEWTNRINMMKPGTDVSSVVVSDVHDMQTKTQQGLSAVCSALMCLAVNALVPSAGSTFWSGFTTAFGTACARAAMVCMLSMTSVSLANNKGNLGNTLHDITGDQAFKSLVVAVGTAGITHGVAQGLPIPSDAHGLVHHGVREVVRETASVSVRALVTGQGGDAGRSVINVAGNIVQGMAAEKVGSMVRAGDVSMPSAVGAHAVIGAAAHMVRGGTLQEAGVVGVATGLAEGMMYACVDYEAIAEKVVRDHPGASPQELQRHCDHAIRPYREMAHITAATLAGVVTNSGDVVNASSHSAQMAMDHNFANLVIGAGLTLHELWPYYQAYEAAGGGSAGRAAVTELIKANGGGVRLGIKIAANFLGGAMVVKAGGKVVQFVKGGGLTFVRGGNAAKVERAQKFLEQANAGDKRAVERLGHKKVKWVDEKAGMNLDARSYNDSASGARSNSVTQNPQAPSLSYTGKDGVPKSVRFDGVENNILIDRKISVVTISKVRDQALRQSRALEQNGMTARWEVPNAFQQGRAERMLSDLKIRNIEVKIVGR